MAVSSSAAQAVVASGHARLNRLLFFLALLPIVLIAAIINHYGVNVPYGDEWSVLTLLGKWDSHQLTFADFYGAHNGHRILIPRLIYLALIQLTHGSLRAEMFFSLFLCILTSAGIYLLLWRTVRGSTTKHRRSGRSSTFSSSRLSRRKTGSGVFNSRSFFRIFASWER